MGGRHRRGAVQKKPSRGAVVGSTGAVLVCAALVYGAGAIRYTPADPDPPQPSVTASSPGTLPPAGTPTLAIPAPAKRGADMNEPEPVRPATSRAPGATAPPTTEPAPARKTRKPDAKQTPRVRRSGSCYLYEYNGVTYEYCPGRKRTPSPRR